MIGIEDLEKEKETLGKQYTDLRSNCDRVAGAIMFIDQLVERLKKECQTSKPENKS